MNDKIQTTSVEDLKGQIDPPAKERSMQSKMRSLRKELDSVKRELGDRQEFEEQLIDAVNTLEPYSQVYKPSKKQKIVSSPVIPVMHWTDWHIGAMIEEDLVEGFNSYSYSIAEERVMTLTNKFISWIELHRTNYKVNEIQIIDTGDNISGDIHEELSRTNEWPVPVQIVKAAELKAEAIRRIACHAEKVNIEFIVPDNHSRRTPKPQFKQAGMNSENYLVGVLAKSMLSNVSNVNFHIEMAQSGRVEVNGRKYLCEHGNAIRGWAGIPYYGMDRKASQEAKRRMLTPKGFHRMIIGHFHHPMMTQYYFVGGSLSGTDEFDHGQGRYSEPSQSAWMVHSKWGEFDYIAFKLGALDE
jgi:hypothetical protein